MAYEGEYFLQTHLVLIRSELSRIGYPVHPHISPPRNPVQIYKYSGVCKQIHLDSDTRVLS